MKELLPFICYIVGSLAFLAGSVLSILSILEGWK